MALKLAHVNQQFALLKQANRLVSQNFRKLPKVLIIYVVHYLYESKIQGLSSLCKSWNSALSNIKHLQISTWISLQHLCESYKLHVLDEREIDYFFTFSHGIVVMSSDNTRMIEINLSENEVYARSDRIKAINAILFPRNISALNDGEDYTLCVHQNRLLSIPYYWKYNSSIQQEYLTSKGHGYEIYETLLHAPEYLGAVNSGTNLCVSSKYILLQLTDEEWIFFTKDDHSCQRINGFIKEYNYVWMNNRVVIFLQKSTLFIYRLLCWDIPWKILQVPFSESFATKGFLNEDMFCLLEVGKSYTTFSSIWQIKFYLA
jgi:hypothetical protein